MEIIYKTNKLAKTVESPANIKKFYGERAKLVGQRLKELQSSPNLEVMMNIPASYCHELKADRDGQLSVMISGNHRIIFKPNHDDIDTALELLSPPGDTLAETIRFQGLSQTELAARMGRPVKTINEIIQGKAAITPETALQLEKVTGISAAFWLERERLYQLELAEIHEAKSFLNSGDWVRRFPLAEMKKHDWISFDEDTFSKIHALLRYFSVADENSYKRIYSDLFDSAVFRIYDRSKVIPDYVITWLRQGEIQANSLKVKDFSLERFKNTLRDIKQLMSDEPHGFLEELQEMCLSCGVKLVYTPRLPKAPISGATRWLSNSPLVQLSGMYDRNDIFWFTFFHEAAHIILHGKKDVFIEGLNPSEHKPDKEKEADEFAIRWTLTHEQEKEIVESGSFDKEQICSYAKKFNTNEALIIGRLAKHGLLHESFGYKHGFYKKVHINP